MRVAWASAKVLDAGKDWKKTCGAAIVRLVQSSSVGEAMFTGLIGNIVGVALQKKLEDELMLLCTAQTSKVDEAVVARWTEALLSKADTVEGIDQLESRRQVTLIYRGAELSVPIRCTAEEVQMRIMAAVKGIAVQSKLLLALHAEDLLGYDTEFYGVAFEIDKYLVSKVGGRRLGAWANIAPSPHLELDAPTIEGQCRRHRLSSALPFNGGFIEFQMSTWSNADSST